MSKYFEGLGHCSLDGNYNWCATILENGDAYAGRLDTYNKNVTKVSKLDEQNYIIEIYCPKCHRREFIEKNVKDSKV